MSPCWFRCSLQRRVAAQDSSSPTNSESTNNDNKASESVTKARTKVNTSAGNEKYGGNRSANMGESEASTKREVTNSGQG